MPKLRSQPGVGRELTMLAHPLCKGGWGDRVAVARFQFGRGLRKRAAEVIKHDAVENNAQRIGFCSTALRERV